MSEHIEALPCPFCGGEPMDHAIEPHTHSPFLKQLGIPDHGGSHVVECGCGVGLIDDTKEAVLKRWNTRLRALSPVGGPELADVERRFLSVRDMLPGDYITGYTEALAHIRAAMLAASPQQEPGADGCGACGDSCANRGACRLADDSPTRLYALAAAIRGEADIADRPGQMARLNAIADELSVHSKPTPADDPSGQTLAGAGGELDLGQFREAVNCWRAVITTAAVNLPFNLAAYRASCGVSVPDRLLALIDSQATTSAGTTGDAKYAELIYAVGRKWPGETRHQTALRYINEREYLSSAKDCGSSAALSPAKENGSTVALAPKPEGE